MDKANQCGVKRGYWTRQEAEDAMYSVVRRTGVRLNRLSVYLCGECKRFHFGHKTKTKR